jgi:hypothetical protein
MLITMTVGEAMLAITESSIIDRNPNLLAPDCAASNEVAKSSQPINGMRSAAERAAIAVLLGASGFLTWMSFVVEHNDLLKS